MTDNRYVVTATWLLLGMLDDEQHFIEVEAGGREEARQKAQPEIDRLSKTYGRDPSLVGIEKRRSSA